MKFILFMGLVLSRSSFALPGSGAWAELDDIIQYDPAMMADAALLAEGAKSDPRLTVGSASFKFGLHFLATPETLPNSDVSYSAAALMTNSSKRLFYRKFEIEVGGTP